MSFRLYFRVIADISQTEIFNNTVSIGQYSDPNKITVLGINRGANKGRIDVDFTDSTINKQYVTVSLPAYTITSKQTFQFRRLNRIVETQTNFEQFRDAVIGISADYILIYINNLRGNPVEQRIQLFLKQQFGTTVLKNKVDGSWMLLAEPRDRARFDISYFTLLREQFSDNNDINLYYLTDTEFTQMNKSTWNQLFSDGNSSADIQTYYQNLFDTMDDLIYSEDSNYIQILARIHHHLQHPRDDNFDGTISDDQLENPYYQIFPESFDTDMDILRSDVRSLSNLAEDGGIDKIKQDSQKIIFRSQNQSRALTVEMINTMLAYRNLYIAIRDEFHDKLNLS